MWIRTQNKQRIINSDQIIDIFIDNTGKKILAETTRDDDFFTLGEYEKRDVSMKVLDELLIRTTYMANIVRMPLGCNVADFIS